MSESEREIQLFNSLMVGRAFENVRLLVTAVRTVNAVGNSADAM